jgi:putative membrane protein
MRHLLNWALSALALWVVAQLVPGFHVSGPFAALIAALVIGFVNATLGLFLKIITFPLTVLTLGVFWLVINAAMIELASAIVKGFHVDTFGSAFIGAIVLSLVNMIFRWLAGTGRTDAAFSKRRAAVCRNACRSRHGCRPHDNWREHQLLEAFY